jgi:hypothetical protein
MAASSKAACRHTCNDRADQQRARKQPEIGHVHQKAVVSPQEICAQDRKADGGKEKTPFTWHTIKGHSKLLLAPARNAAAVCRKETNGLRL